MNLDDFKPGQVLTLKLSNGYTFAVTVVRIGKKRVTCKHAAHTSEHGYHYAEHLKAYDVGTLAAMVQGVAP